MAGVTPVGSSRATNGLNKTCFPAFIAIMFASKTALARQAYKTAKLRTVVAIMVI